jgi:1-acyl-sn-glycerol-3-phosphate acyltransferase
MVYASLQIKFEEDFTRFFPKGNASAESAKLFSQIKIKDKIIILIKSRDTLNIVHADKLIAAAEIFEKDIISSAGSELIRESRLKVDASERESMSDFIYDNIPLFLTKKDYSRLDSLTQEEAVEQNLKGTLSSLLSPAGYSLSTFFGRDPLNIGTPVLASLQRLQSGMEYNLVDDHILSADNSTLLYIVTPVNGSSNTSANDKLVSSLESAKTNVEKSFPETEVLFMGGPTVAVYNARQIKSDTFTTLGIALFIIIFFLYLVFRRIYSIVLLLLPAIFGVLFALTFISLDQNGVSAIAIGSGAMVMGIALSYSIHILIHLKHVGSVEQLIDELAYPLTVGSFTTVGAFMGLLFTQSSLLQDFGLFSALTLIGTTLFSLVFLPHFLKIENHTGTNKVVQWIDKFNAQKFEKNRWIVSVIVILFVAGLFLSPGVRFESDMMKLNYEPESIKKAEKTFSNQFKSNESRVLLLSSGKKLNDAIKTYSICDSLLKNLKDSGVEIESTSIGNLLVSNEEQQERLTRWREYWSEGKKERTINMLNKKAVTLGFTPGAFREFANTLNKEYSTIDYEKDFNSVPKVLREWMEISDSSKLLITQLFVSESDKREVYDEISKVSGIVIIDRAHFTGIWAKAIKEDFYFILFLCSVLVFATLLISYGRFELAILAFIPMMVSWIIILGLMSLFGIPFNIVNILLSTFIFGIGDDFSIFVLDGLQNEFARKKMVLSSHKTAIFFSTFTVIIGMGSLLFARHPALQSVSLISVLGMIAVWGVAFTIQPIIFRFFITSQVEKGLQPYTISGVLLMLLTFSAFSTICIAGAIYIALAAFVPVPARYKKELFHKMIKLFVFLPVRLSPTVRIFKENPYKENFSRPAIIIANHQSFIDILMLLSLTPKIVMMTNKWVWNSIFFGHIVRYAGFIYNKGGVDKHMDKVRERVSQGYSVLIFPEGTRSPDQTIHRFHKGAFLLSKELSLDIIPVLIYGNGNLVSKQQPFYVKHGVIGYRILNRIAAEDNDFGGSYQKRAKLIANFMRREYQLLRSRFDTPQNHFFYYAVLANYIYKGPVLEWYMRIKMKMEKSYRSFHEIIPLDASITDIGCGYGPLCYMLGALSKKRVILGIDYDKDKIEIASNGYSVNERISFKTANATDCEMAASDVFILNDMLHYLPLSDQEILLTRCVDNMNDGGMVIVRDGDAGKRENHRITRLSEWFSINLIGFNKAVQAPCFTDNSQMQLWALSLGCSLEVVRNDRLTSNTIYIFKRK